jgi:glycosyltransferase involved in cell wall biosynthesis
VKATTMLNPPKPPLPVSVVIPAYNAADSLPRAIQSIACQTLLPTEVIIVNDVSTDNTLDVAEQLCTTYPQLSIQVVTLPVNSGPGTARNAGWRLASEDFLAFLDSDDTWHPQKLEIQHQWMCKNPNTVICGHLCQINLGEATIELVDSTNPDTQTVKKLPLRSFLLRNRISTPSVMLTRNIDERFVEGKRYSEDYLLWTQIIAAHGPADFIELPLAFLHKPMYGASGLSGNLWAMQKGEIDSLQRLRRASVFQISQVLGFSVIVLSWLKFIRRLFVRLTLRP